MVQKYHRVWSLLMAMVLLGSCVLSPLSIRVGAMALDDHAIPAALEDSPRESGGSSIDPPIEEPADVSEDASENVPGDTPADVPADESGDVPGEEAGGEDDPAEPGEAGEEIPAALEPDYSGYPVIPGMKELMQARPSGTYANAAASTAFYSYLDLELFEGIEIDHINIFYGGKTADAPYMTVSVADVTGANSARSYRFSPRAEDLALAVAGDILSLYPEETVTVAQGQTLGFGKSGDTLSWQFQNFNGADQALRGFYLRSGFTSGTAGGCLCVDVYAKEEPQTSQRDTALAHALAGKKLSILGDSISTYSGVSNSTAVNSTLGSNALGYTDSMSPFSVLQTWWRQAADRYGMEILVNNSWGSSTVTSKNLTEASHGWNTRPGNLHDNTLTNNPGGAPINPDIIVIYMGTNDVINGVACDPSVLDDAFFARIEGQDYQPETTNFEDACALMVYKVRQNYPDADIFLFNNPTMDRGTEADRAAYNQVFEILAQRYGCTVADLYGSAISGYSVYTTDGVHPNSMGMDVMTEVFADTLYQRYLNHTEHTPEVIPGKAATCVAPGLTDGSRCIVCRELLTAQEEISSLGGHQYDDGVACQGEPYDQWGTLRPNYIRYTCAVCGDLYDVIPKENLIWDSVYLSNQELYPPAEYISAYATQILPYATEFETEGATLLRNTFSNGTYFTLWQSGKKELFTIGLGAEATSTLCYDISRFTQYYKEFTTFVGVDTSAGAKGSVWFEVFTSQDGENWTSLLKTEVLTGSSDAAEIRVNVDGVRYLKLHANSNGSSDYDYSVYGNPRLVRGDTWDALRPLEELDAEIRAHYDSGGSLEEILPTVYLREFISRIDYETLKTAIASNTIQVETLEWLTGNMETLELYLEAGAPEEPDRAIIVMEELYRAYKDILTIENPTTAERTYKKMILAAMVAYAGDFVPSPMSLGGVRHNPYLYPAERVEKMMDLYNQGDKFYNNAWVDEYHMELMRTLMLDYIRTDEVQWLREYTGNNRNPAHYIPYNGKDSMNYGEDAQSHLYKEENNETYNNKYNLNAYGIYVGKDKNIRTWMTFEAGGVCWNIARLGQTLERINGLPAMLTVQPVHEAYFKYAQYESGNYIGQGIWSIGYDVFGWGMSYSHNGSDGKAYDTRYLMGWGSDTPYSQKLSNNAAYILMAQACINDWTVSRQAWQYEMLAQSYSLEDADQRSIRKEIYRDALAIQPLNLECWLGLMDIYEAEEASSSQWKDLALDIAQAMSYYPVPMDDLTREIRNNRNLHEADQALVIQARTAALERCTTATTANTLQNTLAQQYARSLLNGTDAGELVSFSFNGENAGKIILGDVYNASDLEITYSLDGGKTWTEEPVRLTDGETEIQLTPEEIASIAEIPDTTDEAGEVVHFDEIQISVRFIAAEIYNDLSIDILPGTAPVVGLENAATQINIHDGENWIVGKIADLEYSLDGESWLPYDQSIRFEGDQTVQVRYAANGVTLTGPAATLTFTALNESDAFRHVSVSQVGLHAVGGALLSSGRAGQYALDANPFTSWHSAYGIAEADKQIVVKFDETKQLAGLTYQREGSNGCFSGVTVSVSSDGETWTEVGSATGWANNTALKTLTLENSVPAQYVRLQATTHNSYISARDIDFYEDTTAISSTASIFYSTTAPTQGNVTATLMLDSGYTAIGAASHVFTDNGSHEFVYTNPQGEECRLTARVDWIDRKAPTAKVSYSPEAFTQGSVVATLEPDETVTVTNNGGELSHTFTENGSFAFEFADAAGNTGTATATVNWIIPAIDSHVTFSLSGENAGRLMFNSFYTPYPLEVSYRLGGSEETVSLAADQEKVIVLTPQQLAALTTAGITVTISIPGRDYQQTQTIALTAGPAAPVVNIANQDHSRYINIHDGENWILGKVANLEYSSDGIHWTAYDQSVTRFPGNQDIQVRYGANGLTLASGVTQLTFTENDSPEFTHISASEVTMIRDHNGSYYNNRYGRYAIDADPFTSWHSTSGVAEEDKQYVVKFEEPKWLAGLTYQREGSNGCFSGVTVYISDDGEDWTEVGSATGWANNAALKTLKLEKSHLTTYVRLQITTHNSYISARDIDFYEDTTVVVASVDGQVFDTLENAFTAAGSAGEVVLLNQNLLKDALALQAGLTGSPSLTITAGDGTVTFDAAAARTITGNTGDGSIQLLVTDISETDDAVSGAAATYEVTMTQNGSPVFPDTSQSGSATVAVPRPTGLTNPVVYHVASDGRKSLVSSQSDEEIIRFTTGHFSRFSIEEAPSGEPAVSVSSYVSLNGSSIWLVLQSGATEAGKSPTYDGSPMLWSQRHGAYCYLVIAETLSQEEAAARIGAGEEAAATVTATMDVNCTGLVDASDAQVVYNMYNAYYDGFTASVTMETFLRADVNGDGTLDTRDAVAIISDIL